MHYVGLIFADASGGYGVTVPDIPGFTAHVETGGVSAAVDTAQRVLTDHIASMVDAGLEIPEARSPNELERVADIKAEWNDADAFVMLRVVYPAGRTLRVNVTIDENVLNIVDEAASERGLTRSAFVSEACRRLAVGDADIFDQASADRRERNAMPNVTARLLEAAQRMEEMITGAYGRPKKLPSDAELKGRDVLEGARPARRKRAINVK